MQYTHAVHTCSTHTVESFMFAIIIFARSPRHLMNIIHNITIIRTLSLITQPPTDERKAELFEKGGKLKTLYRGSLNNEKAC